MADQVVTDETEAAEGAEDAAATKAAPGAPDAGHGADDDAAHDDHHGATPAAYVGIALVLAVVTALEVGMYYVDDLDDWLVTTILLVMMAVKFFLVAMWFMHLRFEAPIFRRLFYGGAVLAVAAYAVFLGASGVFPFID